MHTNPFTSTGYDLSDLQRQVSQKADHHEVLSLSGNVDRLERSVDAGRSEHRSEIDGLRARIERLEALVLELNPGAAL